MQAAALRAALLQTIFQDALAAYHELPANAPVKEQEQLRIAGALEQFAPAAGLLRVAGIISLWQPYSYYAFIYVVLGPRDNPKDKTNTEIVLALLHLLMTVRTSRTRSSRHEAQVLVEMRNKCAIIHLC